jgi:hypothetical protein
MKHATAAALSLLATITRAIAQSAEVRQMLSRFHFFDRNEIGIELIAERVALGPSPLHSDQLPRIVRLEQLSGFLNRRALIDCFDGADALSWGPFISSFGASIGWCGLDFRDAVARLRSRATSAPYYHARGYL